MATIAVVNIDLGGHLGPALRLSATLARQGHRILVWAPESARARTHAAGCELVPHQPPQFMEQWPDLGTFVRLQAEATAECLPALVEALMTHDVELVVHDAQAPWGRVAADFLGLPRIVSNPLFPGWAEADPGAGWEENTASGSGFPVDESGGFEAAIREHETHRWRVLEDWGIDLGEILETLVSTGEQTVTFTTEAVVGAGCAPRGWCLAGPLMDDRERAVEDGPPIVYAALGTFANRSREAFRTIIEALAGLPIESVVATGGSFSAEELGPLAPNVSVHGFVDSRAMLDRAAVHVTHGGGSSVHESLLAAVPMVCLPLMPDQRRWAESVVACGAGEIVAPTPAAIRAAVLRQLGSRDSRDSLQSLRAQLQAHPGAALVGDLVNSVLAAEPLAA